MYSSVILLYAYFLQWPLPSTWRAISLPQKYPLCYPLYSPIFLLFIISNLKQQILCSSLQFCHFENIIYMKSYSMYDYINGILQYVFEIAFFPPLSIMPLRVTLVVMCISSLCTIVCLNHWLLICVICSFVPFHFRIISVHFFLGGFAKDLSILLVDLHYRLFSISLISANIFKMFIFLLLLALIWWLKFFFKSRGVWVGGSVSLSL